MTLTGLASLLVGCLDGARTRGDKLLCLTNSSQPKTVEIGKVVTGTAGTLALYDGVSPEVLKAATRRTQRLATTLITSPCVLKRKESAFGKLIAFCFHTHQPSFVSHSPGGKSTPSTDSSSQVGMQGPCDPGCEKLLRAKQSHTPHSG